MIDIGRLVRSANPVPGELNGLTDDEISALLRLVEMRSGEMDINEIMAPVQAQKPKRARWLVAAAAFVTVLVIGVTVLLTALRTTTPAATPSLLTWSRVPHDKAVFGGDGDEQMLSVTIGGPGLVAVGWEISGDNQDAAVWTSPDGVTWSRVPDDEAAFGGEDFQLMVSVTVGGPGLVAVGFENSGGDQDAEVWTSPDGITWSRIPHDEAALGGEGDQRMVSVTAGGPGLVAVGFEISGDDRDAAVWTSPDGITWSRIPHDEAVLGGDGFVVMGSVTAGGPGLVAVGWEGGDAAVWTSPDGITWSRVPDDEAAFGGDGGQGMASVIAGGPGVVAVGYDGLLRDQDAAVWTSPDGITWSRVPHDETVFGGAAMSSVTAGGPGLVAVGYDGLFGDQDAALWTSPDGITWSRVPNDETAFGGLGDQRMESVTAGGPGLVAVGLGFSGDDQDAAVWVAATED